MGDSIIIKSGQNSQFCPRYSSKMVSIVPDGSGEKSSRNCFRISPLVAAGYSPETNPSLAAGIVQSRHFSGINFALFGGMRLFR